MILRTVVGIQQVRPLLPTGRRAGSAACGLGAALSCLVLAACSPDPSYPSLSSVPPRPSPTTSVEDRDALARDLARQRAEARYREEVVGFEAGARAAPPVPPAPVSAAPAARATEPVTPPEGRSREAEAYVEEEMARADDDGEIDDFMEQLARPVPGATGAASAAAAVGLAPGGESSPAGGGEIVARIAFETASLNVPEDADAGLQEAVARLRAAPGRLRIEADGQDEDQRLGRARALVVELGRLGVQNGQLRVIQGDAGDEARIVLEPLTSF
jgi:hypothetical protein